MNRSFHRPATAPLIALAVAAAAVGCTPDNNVKSGAPVLTKFIIVQPGWTTTTIDSSATICAAEVATGEPCRAEDEADGGAPADHMCQSDTTHAWCHCDASDATAPVWSCGGFADVRGVISVFDRLLDPVPLAVGPVTTPDAGATNTVMASLSAGAPSIEVVTDYASNGSTSGLLIPFLAGAYYMNFRFDGPSLFTIPTVAFPSGATVTLTLNAEVVHAKDGTTPFTGEGLLKDGTLTFITPPFGAAVSPDKVTPDTTALFVTFNAAVDPDAVASHITVVSSAGVIPVTTAAMDGSDNTIEVTPVDTWPVETDFSVVVDASTPNVLGQVLGTAVTAMVTTKKN